MVFSQLLSDDRFEILFQLAGLECQKSMKSRKTLVEMSMRRQAKDMLTRFDTGLVMLRKYSKPSKMVILASCFRGVFITML